MHHFKHFQVRIFGGILDQFIFVVLTDGAVDTLASEFAGLSKVTCKVFD